MSKLENDILYREIFMSASGSGGSGGGITPAGTKEITENGTYDVTDYASADVNVPNVIPDGYVKEEGTVSITANGNYDIATFAEANVNVPPEVVEKVVEKEVEVIPDGYVKPAGTALLRERFVDYDVTNFAKARAAITDYTGMVLDGGIWEYSNDNLQIMREYALYNCASLESVGFPSVVTIREYAFAYCKKLVSAILTSVQTISQYAFAYCYALDHIDLPELTRVEYKAFYRADALRYVKIGTQDSTTVATATGDPAVKYGYTKIYVADSLVDAYKTATNWATYADNIYPLSEFTEE